MELRTAGLYFFSTQSTDLKILPHEAFFSNQTLVLRYIYTNFALKLRPMGHKIKT